MLASQVLKLAWEMEVYESAVMKSPSNLKLILRMFMAFWISLMVLMI
jgi:hypothetical protein